MKKSPTPHILLIGFGYSLETLARLLPEGSYVATSRSREKVEDIRARGGHACYLELADETSVKDAFESYPDIKVIVDGAPPQRAADPALGIANLLRMVSTNPRIERCIYLSTTGVYGERSGGWVDERTPCRPWNVQGEARLKSEETYLRAPCRICLLRLPAIDGPNRGLEKSLRAGTYRLVEEGESWTNRIHVEDLAQALYKTIVCPLADLPPILCVSDDRPSKQREVVEAYCAKLGLEIPSSVSYAELLSRRQFTQLSNQRVNNARLHEFLNSELRYPSYREWLVALDG